MIRVVKPVEAPAVLRDRGATTRQAHCDDFDNGTNGFNFDAEVYNHTSVKEALLEAQHEKCCYCESMPRHVSFGDVEHFRPKGGFRQKAAGPLGKPGYYWLAYEWTNLFMSCQICNQQFKKNLFPLRHPTRRARSHHDDVGQEQPLLIDPAASDPSRHIAFREEYAHAVRNNLVGRATIDALGLNRPKLVEHRRKLLTEIALAIDTRAALAARIEAGDTSPELLALRDRLDAQLSRCVLDAAEYAAMARAALAGHRAGGRSM